MKETKKERDYYDMVEVVEQFNEEAAEMLYYDVIFQDDFEFSGYLYKCFVWRAHHKGYKYWADIDWQLISDVSV